MFSTTLEFPLGKILLARTTRGLCLALYARDDSHLEKRIELLRIKGIFFTPDETKFKKETDLFNRYFKGGKEDFKSLPLDLFFGTTYQQRVWLESRKISYGETKPYKYIAQKLKHRGYRSVGQALGKNPLLIVIPCHRVLSSDGRLGGFSAGLELKRFLLDLEGISTK